MKITCQIEILDLSRLEPCMRRVGLEMKSDRQVREFFAAVTMTGLGILQNGGPFPCDEFSDLVKAFLTNQQKGKSQ